MSEYRLQQLRKQGIKDAPCEVLSLPSACSDSNWVTISAHCIYYYAAYMHFLRIISKNNCIIVCNFLISAFPGLAIDVCTYMYLRVNYSLISINSLSGRRVMVGLQTGCLSLAVEVGRYTGTPYSQRLCRLCGDRHHFLRKCHTLSSIRQTLFTHCLTLSNSFAQTPSYNKCKFFLHSSDNSPYVSLILQMYLLRQSFLCSN